MPSRCAFPRTEVSLRPSFSPITRVGVLSRASCRSLRRSVVLQFLFLLRVYLGLALRGPLRPIGEPRQSQLNRPRAVFAIVSLPALKMPRDNAWRGTNVPRHDFVRAFQRLSGRFDAHRCFKRSPARITLPQMPHAASVETFRPFGNVNALAALRALDHRTRARESCDIARQFHWGTSRLPETPFPPLLDFIGRTR